MMFLPVNPIQWNIYLPAQGMLKRSSFDHPEVVWPASIQMKLRFGNETYLELEDQEYLAYFLHLRIIFCQKDGDHTKT